MTEKPSYSELEKRVQELENNLEQQIQQGQILKLLEVLLNTIPSPIFHKNKEGIYQNCNRAFSEKILGVPRNEIIGKSLFDMPKLVPPEMAKIYHEQDLELMISGGIQIYEAQVLCKDGVKRDYLFNKTVVKDSRGENVGIIGVMIDITQRIEFEKKLLQSEERFKCLLEASFGGIGIHDNGTIIDVNNSMAELTGYSPEELIGINALELIAPEDRSFVKQRIEKHTSSTYETLGLRKSGETYPMEIRGKTIPYQNKRVRVFEFRDISEAKAKLRVKERLFSEYETIFENSSVGILVLKNGRFFYKVNNRFSEIFGFSEEEVKGQSVRLIHIDENSFVNFGNEHFDRLRSGNRILVDYKLLTKNRGPIWCNLYGKAISPPNIDDGVVWIIEDINEKKLLEEEKERVHNELEQALNNIKTLEGMLAICANCKKIRTNEGEWDRIEKYISERSNAEFSHSICPECMIKLYGEEFAKEKK